MTTCSTTDAIRTKIYIPTIDAVKDFVGIVNNFACTAIIESDRYVIDAKSIMGVFSLDVAKPLILILEKPKGDKTDDRIELTDAIKKYIVF